MPGMPRGLLDHVQHDPTNIGRLESTKPVLAQWGRRERGWQLVAEEWSVVPIRAVE